MQASLYRVAGSCKPLCVVSPFFPRSQRLTTVNEVNSTVPKSERFLFAFTDRAPVPFPDLDSWACPGFLGISTPQRVYLQNSRPHCYSELMAQPLIRLCQTAFCIWFCTGCVFGPSQERVDCLQSCARQKDGCILQASNAMAIEQCDSRGAWCSEQCPQ